MPGVCRSPRPSARTTAALGPDPRTLVAFPAGSKWPVQASYPGVVEAADGSLVAVWCHVTPEGRWIWASGAISVVHGRWASSGRNVRCVRGRMRLRTVEGRPNEIHAHRGAEDTSWRLTLPCRLTVCDTMSAGENTHLALLTATAFLAFGVPGLPSESSLISGANQLAPGPATNLIAWWRFDEPSGEVCKDASGNGHDALPEPGQGAGLRRVDGLFDRALSLSGQHFLRVPGGPTSGAARSSRSAPGSSPPPSTVTTRSSARKTASSACSSRSRKPAPSFRSA